MSSRKIASVFVVLLLLTGCRPKESSTPVVGRKVDLTGEWAVTWKDRKAKEEETIYIWVSQEGNALKGAALDPNLIPADVSGTVNRAEVTFDIGPKEGRGFRAPVPPISTFKGSVTSEATMEGRYQANRLKGGWTAKRTATGTNRTITISADTIVPVRLTSDEYDFILHPLADDITSSVYRPLTPDESKLKESRRTGEQFELQFPIGHLAGWLYYYRLKEDDIRISPNSSAAAKARRIQQKILRALNENGYPWTTIPR